MPIQYSILKQNFFHQEKIYIYKLPQIIQQMYNYFTNQKNRQLSQKLHNQKLTYQKHNQNKQKNDSKLIRRYIQRSTHGHQRMIQANKQIHNYRNYQHQFREFDRNKNIGPPDFYYRARDDKYRVKEAIKQNSNLDQIPYYLVTNPSIHKFRQTKSKQNFKFTAYDTESRVVQTLYHMKTNQVPTSWHINLKSYLSKKTHSRSQSSSNHKNTNRRSTTQRTPKQIILPNLNQKHYPKSLQSIKNSIEIGPLKHTIVNTKNHNKLKLVKKNVLDAKFITVHTGNDLDLNIKERQL